MNIVDAIGRYLSTVLLAFFILTLAYLNTTAAAAFSNLHEGMEVPSFELEGLNKEPFDFGRVKSNKVTVIVFFATWSERSLTELTDLSNIVESLKGNNVEVVAINVDHEHMASEDIVKISNKVRDLGLTIPVLLDHGLETFRNFGVVAVPSTAIVKEGGILLESLNGYPSFAKNEIRDKMEILLGLKKEKKKGKAGPPAYKPVRASLLNYNLGRRLFSKGMVSKAERKLNMAIRADGKFIKPRVLLGHIYFLKSAKSKKYLQKAKGLYREALNISPRDEAALTGLARVQLKEGDASGAEKSIDGVLDKNPGYTGALVVKALILAKRGDEKGAEKYVNDALSLAPMDPHILALAGSVYEAARDLPKAFNYYRKAGEKLGY